MDVTTVIQEYFEDKNSSDRKIVERCVLAVEANENINWKVYYRIIGLIRKRTEYAIVVFGAKKLLDKSIADIKVLEIFPFNKKFNFCKDESRIPLDSYIATVLYGDEFTIGDFDPLNEQKYNSTTTKSTDGSKSLNLDLKLNDYQAFSKQISEIKPFIKDEEDFSSFDWLNKLRVENMSLSDSITENQSMTDSLIDTKTDSLQSSPNSKEFLNISKPSAEMTRSLLVPNPTETYPSDSPQGFTQQSMNDISDIGSKKTRITSKELKNQSSPDLLDSSSMTNTDYTVINKDSYLTSPKYDPQNFVIEKKLKEREQEYCDFHDYTLFVGSWNVNDRIDISVNLDPWLLPPVGVNYPNFYALGFQELDLSVSTVVSNRSTTNTVEDKWFQLIHNSTPFKMKTYKLVERVRMAGILLLVFAEKSVLKHIHERASLKHPTGIMNMVGNKGGVGIRLRIMDTYIVFVNCHLAAGENNRLRRDADFKDIERNMTIEENTAKEITLYENDLVFLSGDLNYRINLDAMYARSTCDNRDYNKLLEHDELKRFSYHVFNRFHEGKIEFLPTYKFEPNTDIYDCGEKNRIPSYCDRIMWYGKRCKQLHYNSVMALKSSDHKPIYSWFVIGVKKINKEKRSKIHEAIIRHVDMIFNMSLPQAELDKQDLHFEDVHFQECRQRTITIKNTGQNEFPYEFKIIQELPRMPDWITIEPAKEIIQPGESKTLIFQVFINAQCVSKLNALAKIDTILILNLIGGKDYFITITVDLVPTCFGLPLALLANLKEPVASLTRSELYNRCKPYLQRPAIPVRKQSGPNPFTIPKELHRMIDYIYNHIEEQELFARPGIHSEVQGIREQLDCYGIDADLSSFSVHSVTEALLVFLSTLYFSVIPTELSRECIGVCNNFEESVKVISKLPIDHQNIFHYITSFLRKLVTFRHKNGTNVESLSMLFVDVLFRDSNDRMSSTKFLQQFIMNNTSLHLRSLQVNNNNKNVNNQ